jgi:hypothetical protein
MQMWHDVQKKFHKWFQSSPGISHVEEQRFPDFVTDIMSGCYEGALI